MRRRAWQRGWCAAVAGRSYDGEKQRAGSGRPSQSHSSTNRYLLQRLQRCMRLAAVGGPGVEVDAAAQRARGREVRHRVAQVGCKRGRILLHLQCRQACGGGAYARLRSAMRWLAVRQAGAGDERAQAPGTTATGAADSLAAWATCGPVWNQRARLEAANKGLCSPAQRRVWLARRSPSMVAGATLPILAPGPADQQMAQLGWPRACLLKGALEPQQGRAGQGTQKMLIPLPAFTLVSSQLLAIWGWAQACRSPTPTCQVLPLHLSRLPCVT